MAEADADGWLTGAAEVYAAADVHGVDISGGDEYVAAGGGDELLPWPRAPCLNFSWDFSAVGLMLKTMPLPQWFFCAQNIQTGSLVTT